MAKIVSILCLGQMYDAQMIIWNKLHASRSHQIVCKPSNIKRSVPNAMFVARKVTLTTTFLIKSTIKDSNSTICKNCLYSITHQASDFFRRVPHTNALQSAQRFSVDTVRRSRKIDRYTVSPNYYERNEGAGSKNKSLQKARVSVRMYVVTHVMS